MNPLGSLPPSNSPQGTLNKTDWKKIGRMMLIQGIGLFVTLGVPLLLNFHYVIAGTDYTPEVLVVVNGVAEVLRRFLSSSPKD